MMLVQGRNDVVGEGLVPSRRCRADINDTGHPQRGAPTMTSGAHPYHCGFPHLRERRVVGAWDGGCGFPPARERRVGASDGGFVPPSNPLADWIPPQGGMMLIHGSK